jgi:Flp pilus assembly protein TadG
MLTERRPERAISGQTLVEFALVLPLFLVVLTGIIVLGTGVYFQQQVTNAAREAARYAAIHSATAQCPTVSNLDPDPPPQSYYRCDAPAARWPQMSTFARSHVFGLNGGDVQLSACWSGYWATDADGNFTDYDALPVDAVTQAANEFRSCTIPAIVGGTTVNIDPRTSVDAATGNRVDIPCNAPMSLTTAANDMASAMSASYAGTANEVTVFACYDWHPPLAGFLLIPETVTLRAVVTETLQYQQ